MESVFVFGTGKKVILHHYRVIRLVWYSLLEVAVIFQGLLLLEDRYSGDSLTTCKTFLLFQRVTTFGNFGTLGYIYRFVVSKPQFTLGHVLPVDCWLNLVYHFCQPFMPGCI